MISVLKLAAHDWPEYTKIEGKVNIQNFDKFDKIVLHRLTEFKSASTGVATDLGVFADFLVDRERGKNKEVLLRIVSNMREPLEDSVKACIVDLVVQTNLAAEVTKSLLSYEDGDDINLLEAIEQAIEDAKESRVELSDNFAGMEELEETFKPSSRKFKWFLDGMNLHLRELIPGDDLIVAARPNKGKTTFMCCQLVSMARETDDDILWFNNEGPKIRIFKRLIQAALKITESELLRRQKAGTLMKEYADVVGRVDKIKVFDVHGKSTSDLIQLMNKSTKIAAIVFDMMDNVHLARSRKQDRTDEVLEQLYIWARNQATIYDAISFKTSQISDGGKDTPFPSDAFLKDSRTGKQGATDTIVTIGHNTMEGMEMVRFIATPKNKLKREGADPMKLQVVLVEDTAEFRE